jgi:hypothetical protein
VAEARGADASLVKCIRYGRNKPGETRRIIFQFSTQAKSDFRPLVSGVTS